MNLNKILPLLITFLLFVLSISAEEFLVPSGQPKQFNVPKDNAKYFLINPGQELVFKVSGPNTIKIYGRVINPAKAGNASYMVYQGSGLIGAMLVTPKPSSDFANGDKSMPLSTVSIQEFSVSEGEQTIKIKSSAKSPASLVALEVLKSMNQAIELVPLVPLVPPAPPKKEEKAAELELVPLVPLTPPPAEPNVAKKEDKPKTASAEPKKEERYKEIIAQSTTKEKEGKRTSSITTVVETTEKPSIGKRHIQLGLDLGMIKPFQSIGGPYFNTYFQVAFFPIKTNYSFGLGLKAGYHNLGIDIKDKSGKKIYSMSSNLIPVLFLVMYSIPVSKLIVTDIFAQGGINIVSADLKGSVSNTNRSGSAIAPSFGAGGALTLRFTNSHSLSLKLGYNGGRASLDFVKDLEVGGIYFTSGYNYTF